MNRIPGSTREAVRKGGLIVFVSMFLSGCFVADRDKMVADGISAPPKYRNAVAIRNVSGDCNISAGGIKPLICIEKLVSNDEIKEGFEKSLAAGGYLATGAPRYYIDVQVDELRGPMMGFDMELSAAVTYTIIDGANARPIPIKSTATAQLTEAYFGATRAKIAAIYALRENFKAFLATLR